MKRHKKRIIRISIYIVYLFLCLGLYEHLFVYHVRFNGQNPQVININDKYEEPGIIVKLRGKRINNIKEESNVNTNKFGTYTVKYYFDNKIKERIVEVRDIEKPIIKLKDKNIKIGYNEEYIEPGYSAFDNYDKDITDKVIVLNGVNNKVLGDYLIKYIAIDSSGNESINERKISVVDKDGPKITFSNQNINVLKGKKVDLNDYTAFDDYDGDVTNFVKVDGKLDINKEGIYNIKYSVKDSHSNETVVNRKVVIQEKNTRGIPVLMYHWFYDDTKGETTEGEANRHNFISKTEVTKQAAYLKENGFYFPTWQELIDYIDGKIDLPKKSVIITDDDCTNTFFNIGLKVFQEYEIPVTSFCITKKTNWQKYKNYKYLDFESHTDSLHERKCDTYWNGAVMCTPYEDIDKDIKTSIEKVGSTYAFAYPFGHYNDDTIKALKNNNIKLAFTIREGKVKRGYNKYLLPRVRISNDTDIETYKKLVN